jgi:NADH-quinone oxidoreductase subunit L
MIILAGWSAVSDVQHFSGWALYALLALAIAAALTAFYMFRLIFMTFFGEYRGNQAQHRYSAMLAAEGVEGPDPHEHAGHDEHVPAAGIARDHGHEHGHGLGDAHVVHASAHGHGHDDHAHGDHGHVPHESPWTMTVALCVLAFLGVLGGHFWLADPGHVLHFWHSEPWFTKVVTPASLYGPEVGAWVAEGISEGIVDEHSHLAHQAHGRAVVLSLFVASFGILAAWFLYVRRKDLPSKITVSLGLLYRTVRRKYYVDEAVNATVIRGCMVLARTQRWLDEHVVDAFVLAVGRFNKALGFLSAWFDRVFVDGAVNAVGLLSQAFGSVFRLLQTGRIQQYAAFAVGGALLTAAWLILS